MASLYWCLFIPILNDLIQARSQFSSCVLRFESCMLVGLHEIYVGDFIRVDGELTVILWLKNPLNKHTFQMFFFNTLIFEVKQFLLSLENFHRSPSQSHFSTWPFVRNASTLARPYPPMRECVTLPSCSYFFVLFSFEPSPFWRMMMRHLITDLPDELRIVPKFKRPKPCVLETEHW